MKRIMAGPGELCKLQGRFRKAGFGTVLFGYGRMGAGYDSLMNSSTESKVESWITTRLGPPAMVNGLLAWPRTFRTASRPPV